MKKLTTLEVYELVAPEARKLREEKREDEASQLYWVMALLENTAEVNPWIVKNEWLKILFDFLDISKKFRKH